MSPREQLASADWIESLLRAHVREMRADEIGVRCEFDPRFPIDHTPELEAALIALVRFTLSTVPSGCEVFIGSARNQATVAAVESGSLTLRWQTAGEDRASEREGIAALRPIIGGAGVHLRSRSAASLGPAFERAGWTFELSAINDDRELWAVARRD